MAAEDGLVVRDLEFAYPASEFRLRVPSAHLARGETGAVIGPSGSGKTTFLDLCAGILTSAGGTVVADGFAWGDHDDAARRRRRISRVGLVFQEFELLDHLTVEENVLLPYFIHPALELDGAVRARARDLAEETGIGHLLARRPRRLSQGERQRVAICRALVSEPTLLLADEPTGNLDASATRAVLELFLAQVRARGATLLVATHDHSLLEAFDQVIELSGEGLS